MARIRVSTVLDATPARVWADIADISSHVEWMEDAVAIRFLTERRRGVGTRFECDTRVGPFGLTDVMEVTRWSPRRAMGIRHVGVVTGTGELRLKRIRGGRTRFTWTERLRFPWWMGGPVGAALGGKPALSVVWRRNLRNLARRFERT